MRSICFAKRCFKEIVRDPLSLLFGLCLPAFMLCVFQLITKGMDEATIAQVPQFQISRLTPAIAVFGYTFISLYVGMIVAKDRQTAFQARLRTSPMTSKDFVFGYTLPVLLAAVIQTIVTYLLGVCFGIFDDTNVTFGSYMLSMLAVFPVSLIFISMGLLFGSLFSEQAVGGVFALIINITILLSGMFMPLETMNSAIRTIAYIFPFAHAIKIASGVIVGEYADLWQSALVLLAYITVITTLAIVIFKKKMQSDKI